MIVQTNKSLTINIHKTSIYKVEHKKRKLPLPPQNKREQCPEKID